MQSENFDKKIRDSLSQRPPENDSPRWDKMEVLLDKHLPVEKKDRRRIFFILFAFLLVGGGAFFVWLNNNGDNNEISANELNTQDTDRAGEKLAPVNDRAPETNSDPGISGNSKSEPEKNTVQKQSGTNTEVNSDAVVNKPVAVVTTTRLTSVKPKNQKSNNPGQKDSPGIAENTDPKIEKEPSLKPTEDLSIKATEPATSEKQAETTEAELQKSINKDAIASASPPNEKQEIKESQTKTQRSVPKKQKDKRAFPANLFFTASAGADLSTIGVGKAGTVKPVIGAGIGYRISNKFSIRTGFYSARKVYDADPEDYHPPYNFWAYYPNMKSIEANCKVYEIPVTIDYTFNSGGKQDWFASAGVSSLLMKEETYDYYYKPNSSPTYITYTRTFKDENKHYFSVLNLSGGYRRNINNTFSVQAEPYVKIAMNGVGFGKVKLNSGGVMVSAIIKPFAKK